MRVSKHSAEELARLGRDDGVDSGSEVSGLSGAVVSYIGTPDT